MLLLVLSINPSPCTRMKSYSRTRTIPSQCLVANDAIPVHAFIVFVLIVVTVAIATVVFVGGGDGGFVGIVAITRKESATLLRHVCADSSRSSSSINHATTATGRRNAFHGSAATRFVAICRCGCCGPYGIQRPASVGHGIRIPVVTTITEQSTPICGQATWYSEQ